MKGQFQRRQCVSGSRANPSGGAGIGRVILALRIATVCRLPYFYCFAGFSKRCLVFPKIQPKFY